MKKPLLFTCASAILLLSQSCSSRDRSGNASAQGGTAPSSQAGGAGSSHSNGVDSGKGKTSDTDADRKSKNDPNKPDMPHGADSRH